MNGHGLADPVAGVGAGEQRVLEDRVEALARRRRRDRRRRSRRAPTAASADPVEVDRRLGGEEVGADVGLAAGEQRVVVVADRVVARGGQVEPADAAVGVEAEVGHVVLAQLREPDLGRARREAVARRSARRRGCGCGRRSPARSGRGSGNPGGRGWRRRRRPRAGLRRRRSGRCWCPSRAGGTRRGCTASGCCRGCRTGARPSWLSWNRKPRKSVVNGWMPTRIESKSKRSETLRMW